MSTDMQQEMTAFFDKFCEDFPSFDGSVIANRYVDNYLVVSSEGDFWQCNTREEVIEYFQSLVDKHYETGVRTLSYENLEFSPIGKKCFLATVTWTMSDDEGNAKSHWTESYNMINGEDGLKIFTSIDHERLN